MHGPKKQISMHYLVSFKDCLQCNGN